MQLASPAAPEISHERGCPWAQFRRDVTDRAFKRRFSDAHDVVILNHHLAAVIRHCEKRTAFAHERLG